MQSQAAPQGQIISEGPFKASDYAGDGKCHLLLAASGSVATIKLPNIIDTLSGHRQLSIRLILTSSASNFLAGQSAEQPILSLLRQAPNVDGIYHDEDEWSPPWVRNASILHIELRRWSHLLVIAPLSANSLAKMASGLADNLLLSVLRAWDTTGNIDGAKKRVVVAPAMNSAMWMHPVTRKHLSILEDEWGVDCGHGGWVEVLRPVEKTLACGDVGTGAMREWSEIAAIIKSRMDLTSNQPKDHE